MYRYNTIQIRLKSHFFGQGEHCFTDINHSDKGLQCIPYTVYKHVGLTTEGCLLNSACLTLKQIFTEILYSPNKITTTENKAGTFIVIF